MKTIKCFLISTLSESLNLCPDAVLKMIMCVSGGLVNYVHQQDIFLFGTITSLREFKREGCFLNVTGCYLLYGVQSLRKSSSSTLDIALQF